MLFFFLPLSLSLPPTAKQDGSRGHLEGLASVYCEMLMAPFGEVLAALEEARLRAWSERSPHSSSGGSGVHRAGHRGNSCHGGLPNSHSQPIYVPGKYSVSSDVKYFFFCQLEKFIPF